MRIGRRDVRLTNQDKVFFPQPRLTKGDLIRYYVDVAPCVLHHVRRRPMQMKRYPDGVDGFFFYQKRVPEPHPDWLDTFRIHFPSGRNANFPVVADAAGLAWIANLGCIELHTWHSRIDDIERPDYLLIDLDPSEGNPWSSVRKIAMVVKEVMDELGLHSFPKTSGATGLHILAPIKPELEFPHVRDFARALAKEVEERIGDQRIATTTWKVADRLGVFVDYGQNARDRTIASAYSIRPTPDARASAPLTWDEVPRCDPAKFTLKTMRKRIDEVGDLTAGMWRKKVSIRSKFSKLGLRLSPSSSAGQELRDRELSGRLADLPPGALLRVLVLAEADQLRAVAEAVALHLVVADLDDQLRLHRRLRQLARAPAIRLREAAVRRALQQRPDALQDLVMAARRDRGGADVVELAVVAVAGRAAASRGEWASSSSGRRRRRSQPSCAP